MNRPHALLVLALALTPSLARGQEPPPTDTTGGTGAGDTAPEGTEAEPTKAAELTDADRQNYTLGRNEYDAKRYEAALAAFRKVPHSPNAQLYSARCLRELGRIPEAYDELRSALGEATTRADTEAKYNATRDAAAAELALLEPRVSHLTVVLGAAAPGLRVTVNGVDLPADRIGTPLTVRPGDVRVIATATKRYPWDEEIKLRGGASRTLVLTLAPEQEAEATPKPAAPAPSSASRAAVGAHGMSPLRVAGIGSFAVGVAGVVVFGVAGSVARGDYAELQDGCGPARCVDPSYDATIDEGRTLTTVANVGLVAGIAGVAIGVPLFILGADAGGAESAGAALEVGPAGLRYRGRF